MKTAATGLALAAAGVTLYNKADSTTDNLGDVEKTFQEHIVKYNKQYKTQEEYKFRLAIFEKNYKTVEEFNGKIDQSEVEPQTLELNNMADWTSEEYKKLLGYKPKEDKIPETEYVSKINAPDSVDWVAKGAVTDIKNQGQCGSCWAFSTTGSMEGRYQIAKGKLPSLSEQQFVDCSKDGNKGCQGGLMDDAFKYAEANQIDSETQYPYTGRNGNCHAEATGAVEKVSGYQDVHTNSPKALVDAISEGPVSVAIDASGIFFQLYRGGVMKWFCGTNLDHGVLIVGYGSTDGTDYYLLKNSWGKVWGDKGYFKILRSMNKEGAPGVCGLQKQPSYPVFS